MLRKVNGIELMNILGCLNSLLMACESMPGIVQYVLDKNLKALEPFADKIEKERVKAIEENCDKDEEGNPITVVNERGLKEYVYSDDDIKRRAAELVDKAIKAIEVEIPVHQIPLSAYSEVKVNTSRVVNQPILFDIYIDENK